MQKGMCINVHPWRSLACDIHKKPSIGLGQHTQQASMGGTKAGTDAYKLSPRIVPG